MSKRKHIPNPNHISFDEKKFIENEIGKPPANIITSPNNGKKKFKGYMISMPEEFYAELTEYLKENPIEGSKSSFIVRVVGEHIKSKKIQDANYQYKNQNYI